MAYFMCEPETKVKYVNYFFEKVSDLTREDNDGLNILDYTMFTFK